jgi:DNA-binding response OmpR family regulator
MRQHSVREETAFPSTHIVFADESPYLRHAVPHWLGTNRHTEAVADGPAAMVAVRNRRTDLLIASAHLPKLGGIGLVRAMRSESLMGDLPVILTTRLGVHLEVDEGLGVGAADYIVKPFSPREIVARVDGALRLARVRREFAMRITAEQGAMRRLNAIGSRCVQAGYDIDACLSDVLDAAIAITHADKGNVQLLDVDSGSLVIAVQRGFYSPFLRFFARVEPGDSATCGEAMLTARRAVVEDVTVSPVFAGQPSLRVLLEAGVRAVQSTPLLSSNGAVLGMISTHFSARHRPSDEELGYIDLLARQAADFVERKRAEEALRRVHAQLRAIVDAAPLGMYLVDGDLRIREVNPAMSPVFADLPRLIGRDLDEVIHRVWPHTHADEMVHRVRQALATGEAQYIIAPALNGDHARSKATFEWRINRIPLSAERFGVACYLRVLTGHSDGA